MKWPRIAPDGAIFLFIVPLMEGARRRMEGVRGEVVGREKGNCTSVEVHQQLRKLSFRTSKAKKTHCES